VDLELRRFADARKKLGEAIALREEALGKDHPDVGTARYNLGGTLEKFGDYAAAHDERVRAHAIMRGKYGEGSPKTARYDVGVAHLLYRLGRFDEALAGYRRAIAVYERWPGTETDASTAHEAIARVFRAQGKAAQALPELERALALREKASGADDPTVASVLENLAGALEEAGRPADALAKLDRAERILVQAHGKPAYALADIFAARGSALDALGRRDDAIRAYEEAITVVERAHGRTFVDLGRHLHNLGLVKKKKGDAEGALAAYRRSLEVLQAVYADDHPFVSQSLDANGWLLMDELDRPAEAVPLFERLLAARQKKLGADAKKTQEARAALEEAKKRAAKQPKKKKR
jgi:tetratricopeptide (TPR) repeat protein